MISKEMFSARVGAKIENRPGTWNSLRVEIIKKNIDGETKVGEYVRNYHSLYHTFCPFEQGGILYALYSPDYTGTRIMRLPDCVDMGGESRNEHGFCPVDYFVPDEIINKEAAGKMGFVAGCVWGDDSSWKIQYLDLSKVAEGILIRSGKFGYLEMPKNFNRLEECISMDYYNEVYGYGIGIIHEKYCRPSEDAEWHENS